MTNTAPDRLCFGLDVGSADVSNGRTNQDR
jgi:hypothetical protein